MANLTLETSGATVGRQPNASALPSALDTTVVLPEIGLSIDAVRAEIDDAFSDVRRFHNLEPDEIYRLISGHSGRLAELRGQIYRVEDFHRQWKNIRVREVEPALDELYKQFTFASRVQASRELDYRMESGK